MGILRLRLVVPTRPDGGPKVKRNYLLRYLAQHHEVTLAAFWRRAAEEAAAHELEGLCRAVYTVPIQRSRLRDIGYLLASFFSARPFLMLRDESQAMRRQLRDLLAREQFDLAHADQLNMFPFARATGLPVVL